MGAAVSIVVLFAISSTIVRVAGVFLEHTGIPRYIARLQAMSALSGTGFTTTESELIVQTPERRKILMILIITGSIGLASVVATLVVGAFGVGDTPQGIALQLAAIALSILFVRYVLLSQTVDDLICGLAYAWLAKSNVHVGFNILCQLGPDHLVAAHRVSGPVPKDPSLWPMNDLVPLGARPTGQAGQLRLWSDAEPDADEEVILAGPQSSHLAFAETYGQMAPHRSH